MAKKRFSVEQIINHLREAVGFSGARSDGWRDLPTYRNIGTELLSLAS